jgi:hypothetical protein
MYSGTGSVQVVMVNPVIERVVLPKASFLSTQPPHIDCYQDDRGAQLHNAWSINGPLAGPYQAAELLGLGALGVGCFRTGV